MGEGPPVNNRTLLLEMLIAVGIFCLGVAVGNWLAC
jgi:hypothetical protein